MTLGRVTYNMIQDMPYGAVKWVGEKWVDQIATGKSLRFWNVYGFEAVSAKSHVIPDWIASCLERGTVRARSDGWEQRQVRVR